MINIMTLKVEDYWDSAEVMLKDAIEMSNGRHTLKSTYEKLKSGVMNLYGVFWGDKCARQWFRNSIGSNT